MTEQNSGLLVPVLEAISNISSQEAGQVRHLHRKSVCWYHGNYCCLNGAAVIVHRYALAVDFDPV